MSCTFGLTCSARERRVIDHLHADAIRVLAVEAARTIAMCFGRLEDGDAVRLHVRVPSIDICWRIEQKSDVVKALTA